MNLERCFYYVFSDPHSQLPSWFYREAGIPDCHACQGLKDRVNGCNLYEPAIFEEDHGEGGRKEEVKYYKG